VRRSTLGSRGWWIVRPPAITCQALFILAVDVLTLVVDDSHFFWLLIKGAKGERPREPAPARTSANAPRTHDA